MKPAWGRAGLVVMGALNVFTGFWASVDPHAWWTSFPGFGHAWVIGFGTYNEHLVRDVGGFFLAFGVVFVLAAIYLERRFATAVLVSWLFFAIPHLTYHLRTHGNLSSTDNLLSLEGLAFEVALPILLIVLILRSRWAEPPAAPQPTKGATSAGL